MINQKINNYIHILGVLPTLDDWLIEMNKLADNINSTLTDEDKDNFVASLDALVTLFNNGTYYEIDKDNKSQIEQLKNKLIMVFDGQTWNEEQIDLLYHVYLHSF